MDFGLAYQQAVLADQERKRRLMAGLGQPPMMSDGGAPGVSSPPNSPNMNIPPNVLANLQTKGLASAGASAMRSAPPKDLTGPPTITQPTPGNPNPSPTGVAPPPTGSPGGSGPSPGLPNPASQTQGLLAQWAPEPPPFQAPALPQAPKGQQLGEALAALFIKGATPFVENEIVYDDAQRQKDYENKYRAALDQWTTKKESAAAENQGLVQRADILRNMPPDLSKLIPPIPQTVKGQDGKDIPFAKGTPYQQHMAMADWGLSAARTLQAAGFPDYAQGFRQQADSDRMIASSDYHTATGKPPAMRVGQQRPDGTFVQPGDPEDLAFQDMQSKTSFDKLRVGFEQQAIALSKARTDAVGKALQLRAQQISESSAFHTDELTQRWQINGADRQTRLTVAILGLEAAGLKANAADVERAGLAQYAQLAQNAREKARLEAAGTYTGDLEPGNLPPMPAGPNGQPLSVSVPITIDVPGAVAQAQKATGDINNNVKPPTVNISDPQLSAAIASPKFAALDPAVKGSLLTLAQRPGATFNLVLRNLSAIASNKVQSQYLSRDQALAALAALAVK